MACTPAFGRPVAEIADQFQNILRKAVARIESAPQGAGRHAIGARRATDAKVDPAGIERGEGAELLGHHQRGVVGQHDAAGADADGLRALRDMADEDGRRGAGDAGHVVMFGQPEAVVAERFGMAGEVERIGKRGRRGGTLGHRREVENGKRDHAKLLPGTEPRIWGAGTGLEAPRRRERGGR